jgi:hypothetical protein
MEKKEKEEKYPERGWVMYRRDKKTRQTIKITNPLDDQEARIRELNRPQEEERVRRRENQLIYEAYRKRIIEIFEEDLAMGRRDDINSVEDYIAYLDSMDIDEVEDEIEEEEDNYDDQEEYN